MRNRSYLHACSTTPLLKRWQCGGHQRFQRSAVHAQRQAAVDIAAIRVGYAALRAVVRNLDAGDAQLAHAMRQRLRDIVLQHRAMRAWIDAGQAVQHLRQLQCVGNAPLVVAPTPVGSFKRTPPPPDSASDVRGASALERLTQRSEQLSVGRGRRAQNRSGRRYMPIPSTGRGRLAVSAVVLLAALISAPDTGPAR